MLSSKSLTLINSMCKAYFIFVYFRFTKPSINTLNATLDASEKKPFCKSKFSDRDLVQTNYLIYR